MTRSATQAETGESDASAVALTWNPQEIDNNTSPVGFFGNALALDDRTLMVGGDDGVVHVYGRSRGTWRQTQALMVGVGQIALDRDEALVEVGSTISVLSRVHGTWEQVQQLEQVGDQKFGGGIAISGDRGIVDSSELGTVYMLKRGVGGWTVDQTISVTPPDPYEIWSDLPVAIFGETAAFYFRAVDATPGEVSVTHEAYVYVLSNGSWSQLQVLAGNTSSFGESSLSLDHDTLILGTPYVQPPSPPGLDAGPPDAGPPVGQAFVFVRSHGTWTLDTILSDGFPNFGARVAVSGSTAVVSEFFACNLPGKAFVFERSGGTWAQALELNPGLFEFGASLGISGATIAVAAPCRPLPLPFDWAGAVLVGPLILSP